MHVEKIQSQGAALRSGQAKEGGEDLEKYRDICDGTRYASREVRKYSGFGHKNEEAGNDLTIAAA